MSKQLYEIGDKVADLEVVAVTYREEDDERVDFTYQLKHPDDIQRPETTEAE